MADVERWHSKVFAHWNLLENLSKKRFKDVSVAIEATSFVLDQLEKDDWKRVRGFQGRSNFTTYLSTMATRLLEDFSRIKYGRIRPPQWIKDRGALWIEIFKRLCLEKFSRNEVIEIMTAPASKAERNSATIDAAVTTILENIIDCGKTSGAPESHNADPEFENPTDTDGSLHRLSPEKYVTECERMFIVRQLSRFLSTSPENPDTTSTEDRAIHDMLRHFFSRCRLTAEERLFLRMHFQDALTVSHAGRILGWNTSKANRMYHRLLRRIRTAGKKSGLLQELKNYLQHPASQVLGDEI